MPPLTAALRPRHRPRPRRLVAVVLGLGLLVSAGPTGPTAAADATVAPAAGSFTVKGAGFGHGYGMSQYGAYGAARQGLSWKQILAFYYPGTKLGPVPAGSRLRVWLSADGDGDLRVRPAPGLRVSDRSGHSLVLPTGAGYTSWRVARSGSGYRLGYRTASGTWKTRTTDLSTSTWSFSTTRKVVEVVLPSGSSRAYRGTVALVKRGSGGRTVNSVLLEDYVRSVVPLEMPTSWAGDAVRVQAVAARSYAVRLRDHDDHDGYDICDTSSCQVYGGVTAENAQGDAAVRATAGTVVTFRGEVALTQFASSNGGASAAGTLPYLAARPDPYDGVVTSQAWSRTVSAAAVARVWPSVGAVRGLQVTSRDGSGRWGGRVSTIKITGARSSVTVSGATFQSRFGLRSSLYTVAAPAPAPAATTGPR